MQTVTVFKEKQPASESYMRDIVNKSSEVNRTIGLFMVAFLFYLLITVGSVSDLQLLTLNHGLSLPLINIALPILSFAWVAPIIIVGIHLNVLLNLLEHSKKLITLLEQEKLVNKLDSIQIKLHPFLFNYTMVGGSSFFLIITRILVNVCVYFLPILVLFYIEYRFADLQDLQLTNWHFKLFIIDSLLVLFFYPVILYPTKKKTTRFFSDGLIPLISFPILLFTIVKNAILLVKNISNGKPYIKVNVVGALQAFDQFVYWSLFLLAVIYCFIVSLLNYKSKIVIAYKNGESMRHIVQMYFDKQIYSSYHFLQLHNSNTMLPIPHIEIKEEKLALASPTDERDSRSRKEDGIDLQYTKGLQLANRSLNLARFVRCEFYNGDFSKSNMHGAYFYECKFTSSNFKDASLHHSEFWKSSINNCNFNDANLDNIVSILTKIHNTDFTGAELSNAVFSASICSEGSSEIIGCNFWSARLNHAQLNNMDLTGNSFTQAFLDSANFEFSNLTCSNLCAFSLMGTDFSNANFDAVYLTPKVANSLHLNEEQLTNCYVAERSAIKSNPSAIEHFSQARMGLLHNAQIPIRNLFTSTVYHNQGMSDTVSANHNYNLFLYCRKCPLQWRIIEYQNLEEPFKSSLNGFEKWGSLVNNSKESE